MSTRGGIRAGAGRPVLPPDQRRQSLTIRLPRWLLDQLPTDGRSELIERLLVREYPDSAPHPHTD
jgi:hypothetical protein